MTLIRSYLPATVLGVWALFLIAGADPITWFAPGLIALAVAFVMYARHILHRLNDRKDPGARDRRS